MYMVQNMSPRVPDRVDVVVPYRTKVRERISLMHFYIVLANLGRRLALAHGIPPVDERACLPCSSSPAPVTCNGPSHVGAASSSLQLCPALSNRTLTP